MGMDAVSGPALSGEAIAEVVRAAPRLGRRSAGGGRIPLDEPRPLLDVRAGCSARRGDRRRRLPAALVAGAPRLLGAACGRRAGLAPVLLPRLAARRADRAGLADRRARRSAVLHAHGPAHAAARPDRKSTRLNFS